MRLNRGLVGWALLVGLILLLAWQFQARGQRSKDVNWSEFRSHIESDRIEGDIIIKNDRLVATLRNESGAAGADPDRIHFKVGPDKNFYREEVARMYRDIREEPGNNLLVQILFSWGVPILLLVLLWFIVFRSIRSAGSGMGMLGNFGRSRHRMVNKELTKMTLADVAGIEEAKDEVFEIIEFLKSPKKFQRLGGRIPRGVLLIGQPGCGKTLLAKAVAGEAEVPFFSISGSDFVEMFVGVGASRVRDLFKQAKESSPCIIFLDEIDAVGRRRGSGFGGGGSHDEREQTLNAILVEMDGFESNDQVIVVAATNRADVLDPALTRPGRFDRQINVPLPDLKGRMEILGVHAKNVKMSSDVDMERLARGTPMFSGADLAAIINEAAIIATLASKDSVEQADLEEARDKVRFGRANKSRRIEEEERIGTAFHEAGHAVLQQILPHADPLHKVTIIPRGPAMGATLALPEKDRYGLGRNYLHDTMRVLCGGRIAEHRKTGDLTSGASMDIHMATEYARHMILEWGMSERLGFVDYTPQAESNAMLADKAYSDETARQIDEEIKRLIDEAYHDADRMIDEHWDKIVTVAEGLLKYETLTADDLELIMGGGVLDKPTVAELLEAESRRKPDPEPDPPATEPADPEPDPGAMPEPA